MTDSDSNAKAAVRPRTRSRWWWVLVIVSLGFNVLIFGSIIGHRWGHGSWYGDHHRGWYGSGGRSFIHNLPEGRRQKIETIRTQHRNSIMPLREQVSTIRQEVAVILEQEPLDEAQLRSALERLNTASLAIRQASVSHLVEMARILNPSERKAFLKRLHRRHRGHRRWQGDQDNDRARE